MTPAELVKLFRREIDDRVTPYLWSDDDVYHYLDQAQREFARMTLYLSDATTAETCSTPVVAGEKFVDISPLVIQIRRAKLLSMNRALKIPPLDKVHELFSSDDYGSVVGSNWETATGTPRALVMNIERDKGRLVPIPTADDTLELMVYRYPLETVTAGSTELEVTDPQYQRILLLEMKSLAYESHDSDVNNDALALSYHKRFEDACIDVYWQLQRARDKNWTVRSAWV